MDPGMYQKQLFNAGIPGDHIFGKCRYDLDRHCAYPGLYKKHEKSRDRYVYSDYPVFSHK